MIDDIQGVETYQPVEDKTETIKALERKLAQLEQQLVTVKVQRDSMSSIFGAFAAEVMSSEQFQMRLECAIENAMDSKLGEFLEERDFTSAVRDICEDCISNIEIEVDCRVR